MIACVLLASFASPNLAFARTQSSVKNIDTVENTVRAYYADVPILIAIAACESNFRQHNSNGKPLYNAGGSSAIGVMQIMSSVHRKSANQLGLDITTTEGNLMYARHLYEEEGTRPWNASRHCWK